MPAHVIYTFPIALSYSAMFRSVSDYFRTEILPMIKIKQINGDVYLPGIEAIKNILSLRFELSLFKEKALNRAIMSTGGSLRDLFKILADAATRAGRRNSEIIELEDVNIALNKLSSTLTRMIETNNYKLLIKIHESEIEKQKIENRDNSLELMQAMVLLEYNTKRWCDVHPLVVEFLEGLGEIE